MSSPFIPMDTPDQPQAASTAPALERVCPPDVAQESPAGKPDAGAATTARLRAGLASRLRSAYELGAELDDLATASHQSVSEVRDLLELAGADPNAERVVAQGLWAVPAQRDGASQSLAIRDGWGDPAMRPRPRIRRPSPPRRPPRPGRGTPIEDGAGLDTPGTPGVTTDTDGAHLDRDVAAAPAPECTPRGDADRCGGSGPTAEADRSTGTDQAVGEHPADDRPPAAEPPLGVLIGRAQRHLDPPARVADECYRRVAANLIKVGRGTTLAVLPSWRPSIAISVSTELLLDATGLSHDELRDARLTVLIDPEALHDRELHPHDWQVGPGPDAPRRRRG